MEALQLKRCHPQLSPSLPGSGETNWSHCLNSPRRRSPWILWNGKEHKRRETDSREGQGRWAEEHLMCTKASHTSVRSSLSSEPNSVPTFPCFPCSVTCGEREGPQGHCSVERCHRKAFTGTTVKRGGKGVHQHIVKKARSLLLGLGGWNQVWTMCKPSGVPQAQSPKRGCADWVQVTSYLKISWQQLCLPLRSRQVSLGWLLSPGPDQRLPSADAAAGAPSLHQWAYEITSIKCLLLRISASWFLNLFQEKSTGFVCIGALSHLGDFAWSRLGNAPPSCSQTMLDTGVTIRNYMCQYFNRAPQPEHEVKAVIKQRH